MPQIFHPDLLIDQPVIRRIGSDRPLYWLAAGWADLRANPVASLGYGLLFAIGGDIILLLTLPYPHLFSLAVSGFFLLAPFLAAGLYEISRRRQRGQSTSFIESLDGWRRNGESIALFAFGLVLVTVIWERMSAVLFTLLYSGAGTAGLGLIEFFNAVVASGKHTGFVIAWFITGGSLAAFVFALGAISVPMMLDRDPFSGGDVFTTLMTSLRAVLLNLDAMFLWAMLLVMLTLVGFATFLFGLIVLMPLLGHASWHAYRELVELE